MGSRQVEAAVSCPHLHTCALGSHCQAQPSDKTMVAAGMLIACHAGSSSVVKTQLSSRGMRQYVLMWHRTLGAEVDVAVPSLHGPPNSRVYTP